MGLSNKKASSTPLIRIVSHGPCDRHKLRTIQNSVIFVSNTGTKNNDCNLELRTIDKSRIAYIHY